MKQKLCMLLAVLLVLTALVPRVGAAEAAQTGSCGENANYTLYPDGRLVITGTGAIRDFAFASNEQITSVEIGSGITAIGVGAFERCTSLTGTLVIPDSVTSLCGSLDPQEPAVGAFGNCTALTGIVIGSGVTAMPYGVLSGCHNLRSVIMPDGITVIAPYALSFCHRLNYVEIPAAVTAIGSMAFVNDFSLTTVVFKGHAPAMDGSFFCGSFNAAGFYPAGDASWTDVWDGDLISLMPYTVDSKGALIPQAPDEETALWNLMLLQNKYPEGTVYGDNFSYIINGNFVTGTGSEAFAFQVSDAICGYLPLGEIQAVDAAAIRPGDILYAGGECCTVIAVSGNTFTVAGLDGENLVCYEEVLTLEQVELADGIRPRAGVAIYPGLMDPALDFVLQDLPTAMPTEQQVLETILALRESYPEGMPYSTKNHFHSRTEAPTWTVGDMPVSMSMYGHGCSAFAYLVSDLCFGNLPARYLPVGEWDYEDLRVGDSLEGLGHQVIVLEVHEDHVVLVEGNYEGIIHWGRTMTREECLKDFALYTRYPENYPFSDVPKGVFYSESVDWAVENGITTGTSATTFNPDGQCQRAQVVTFLWRAAGQPEPTTTKNPFVDVKNTDFYYKAVLWAVEKGITNGTDATHFGPNQSCNRAQVVTFLYRAMETPEVSTTDCPFTDVEEDQWYEQAVLWAVENGVTNGMSADSFGVNTVCNRAQVVTFLYRTYVN